MLTHAILKYAHLYTIGLRKILHTAPIVIVDVGTLKLHVIIYLFISAGPRI